MPLMSQLGWIGLGKEGTQGTSVSSTAWIPATSIKPEDMVAYVNDTSISNNATLVRNVYQGEMDSTFAFDGFLYPDYIGNFLVAAGFADTPAGSSTPVTHTFKIPAAGTQPPSYTLQAYDNVDYRYYRGQVLDTLEFVIDAKGAAKFQTSWKGWPSASSASSAPTFPTDNSFLGWQASSSIGGSAVTRTLSTQVSIKRNTEVIHSLGNTQNPYNVFAGPVEVTWKSKFIVENNTEWNHMITNDVPIVVVNLTYPGGVAGTDPVFTMTSTKTAFTKAVMDYSQKYMQLDCDVTGFYSSTDGSAAAFTLVNTVVAAY